MDEEENIVDVGSKEANSLGGMAINDLVTQFVKSEKQNLDSSEKNLEEEKEEENLEETEKNLEGNLEGNKENSEEENPKKEIEEEKIQELSRDEIDSKLEELNNKKEEELTEEDKTFIEENKLSAKEKFYQGIGEEEGINLEDYDNNIEGVAKLSSDVISKRSNTLAKQIVEDTFKQIPELHQLYDHINGGKSLETFLLKHHVSDFATIDVSLEDGQKQMISYYYKNVKNLDDFSISTLLESHSNSGKLSETAKVVKTEMDTIRNENIERINKEEDIRNSELRVENDKMIADVQGIIRGRKIRGLSLTANEAQEFEKQMLEFNSQSKETLVEKAYSELDLEERLVLDYLTLNKTKLKSLFSNKSKKIESENLDKEFTNNKIRKSVKTISNSDKTHQSEVHNYQDLGNIDLSGFFQKSRN